MKKIDKNKSQALKQEIKKNLKSEITVDEFISNLDEESLAVLTHLAQKELISRNSRYRIPGARRSVVEE